MRPGLFITTPITFSMYGVTFDADVPRRAIYTGPVTQSSNVSPAKFIRWESWDGLQAAGKHF